MMPGAQPPEILFGLNPRTDRVRIGDTGIVMLERGEVDAVLQTELDVGVVEFEAGLRPAFGDGEVRRVALRVETLIEADAFPDEAACRRPVRLVVVVEVDVVRVVGSGRMGWEVNEIGVGLFGGVRGGHRIDRLRAFAVTWS
jgi:hypothetical protein